jgi:hypothetical protein
MWTKFWDMHSGGGQKEKWAMIFIEAPEDEAKIIFYNRFGHNPERVTCTCCGDDYSISEEKSLEQATAFHRNCKYDGKNGYIEQADEGRGYAGKYVSLDEYLSSGDVLTIYANEINLNDKIGDIPQQGYVWVD